jgi:hypothetical protein
MIWDFSFIYPPSQQKSLAASGKTRKYHTGAQNKRQYISDFAGISVPSLKICFLVAQYIPYSGKKQEEISYSAKTQAGGEKPPA